MNSNNYIFINQNDKLEKSIQERIDNILVGVVGKLNYYSNYEIKRSGFNGGFIDSYMRLPKFNCGVEIKCTKSRGFEYDKQLTQALAYHILDPSLKVLILASEKYFDYIIVSENKAVIKKYCKKYRRLLQKGGEEDFTPRTLGETHRTPSKQFKIHRHFIDDGISILDVMQEICGKFK